MELIGQAIVGVWYGICGVGGLTGFEEAVTLRADNNLYRWWSDQPSDDPISWCAVLLDARRC